MNMQIENTHTYVSFPIPYSVLTVSLAQSYIMKMQHCIFTKCSHSI